jgi:arylsulfatase
MAAGVEATQVRAARPAVPDCRRRLLSRAAREKEMELRSSGADKQYAFVEVQSMNRRDFLAMASSSVAAGGAISALALPEGHAAPGDFRARRRPPNVILMICDDLGYGDPGCYGSNLPTPNLDAMAAEGLRCTHFNAGHPICSASRAALLTGRYGHRSNTTGAFGPHSVTGTSLDETLLSNLFHDQGYKTKAIGKWHLGDAPEYLPTNRGFDAYYGVPYSVDMYPLPMIRDTTSLEPDTDRKELTRRYTEEATSYIEQQTEAPFFLYLAFSYPHDPARASERFQGKTKFGDVGDAIAEIDWSVGEITKAVENKKLGPETLVLFTSDHGPWYQGSAGLLRGRKASTFEGGFRVPFLARWPGVITGGRVVDQWCSSLDVLPTLCTVCGLKPSAKPLDGVDKSELLFAGKQTAEDKPILYFSPMGNRGIDIHCIRRQEWKLRVAQGIGGEVYLNDRTTEAKKSAWLARPELYNIALDPAESYDVAALHPEIVAGLLRDLDALLSTFPPDVGNAYAALKKNAGSMTTPPGASPRPRGQTEPDWSWEPGDRRGPQ